ncbi:MAG: hypothetical protein EOM02_05010 [Synergistales bacterium]|nr:hypothetical protein [Synergistales bacterium]
MTKEQEIKALEQFIASLPKNTYLYEFFAEGLVEISNAIRSDMWYEPLKALKRLRQEQMELVDEIKWMRDTVKSLKFQEQTAKNEKEHLKRSLLESCHAVGEIHRALQSAVQGC